MNELRKTEQTEERDNTPGEVAENLGQRVQRFVRAEEVVDGTVEGGKSNLRQRCADRLNIHDTDKKREHEKDEQQYQTRNDRTNRFHDNLLKQMIPP